MRKQLIFGALVSALCLYFVFRGISFRELGHALAHADLRWIALGLGIYSIEFMIRAIRWEGLMKPIKPISAMQLLRPMIIGFFANNVLPFRMGELVRAHVTGQRFGISRTASLGTIVLERIFDTLSFLGIFLAVAFFFPFPGAVKHAASALGAGCFIMIGLLFLASKHQERAHALITHFPISQTLRKKLQHLLLNFTQGVSGMTQGAFVAKAMLLSIVVWTIEGSTVYFIAHAFPNSISYPQAFFLLFFLGLAVTLPQAPGYVGTVELFGVSALSLLGIPKNEALSIILSLHGSQFVFILALGLWALWKEKMSLSGFMAQEKQTD